MAKFSNIGVPSHPEALAEYRRFYRANQVRRRTVYLLLEKQNAIRAIRHAVAARRAELLSPARRVPREPGFGSLGRASAGKAEKEPSAVGAAQKGLLRAPPPVARVPAAQGRTLSDALRTDFLHPIRPKTGSSGIPKLRSP